MAMALAGAMVACSGAAGTPGPAGPKGDPGETTTPTPDPTETPEPTVDNAAPMLKMAFKPVYLTVKGVGMKMNTPTLSEHITDADSVLRFALTSSAATIASVEEKSGVWTIKAVKAGPATITVMAHDGANTPLSTTIAVTVVKENKAPTALGLSGSDKAELEKDLYINDGARTDTITIKTDGGEAGDAVVDYRTVVGKDDEGKDDNATVVVTNGSGNTHVVVVTPKKLGAPSQKVQIYPQDMFGAEATPWEFMANFNTPPKTLTESFSKEVTRPIDLSGEIDHSGNDDDNAVKILIAEYFQIGTLDINTDGTNADMDTAAVDLVGDTNCVVTPTLTPSTIGVVTPLNETGAEEATAVTYESTEHATGNQAVLAVLINSLAQGYGSDKQPGGADALGALAADDAATGEGTITVKITCSDKDASAQVTGTVVVRQAQAAS